MTNYSIICEENWKKWLKGLCPYKTFKPEYMFYHDFSVNEYFQFIHNGKDLVKKHFKKMIKCWKYNYKAFTELIMVLNHKSYMFGCNVDSKFLGIDNNPKLVREIAKMYADFYYEADELFRKMYENNDEAMLYYYYTTD